MNFLLYAAVQNTIVVAVMIVPVALVCRLFRERPAVQHLLWLVVLLKFMMPVFVVWPWSLEEMSGTFRASKIVQSKPALDEVSRLPEIGSGMQVGLGHRATSPAEMQTELINQPAIASQFAENPIDLRKATIQIVVYGLSSVWFAGIVVCLTVQIRKIRRFNALVRVAELAPQGLIDRVNLVARQVGVKSPSVFVMTKISSPCLWCFGRTKLLWPISLIDSEDLAETDSLIAHELAHLRRFDHWTSWLDFAGGIVWWWNPMMSFVRRRLRESAEMACDAIALDLFADHRRSYAEFLLEFSMAKQADPAPVLLGMSAGTASFFECRLKMIVSAGINSRLSFRGVLFALLVAIVAIPGWSVAQQTENSRPSEKAQSIQVAQKDDEQNNEQSSLNEPRKAERRIAGQVIDENGEPIVDALVFWNVSRGRPKGIEIKTTTDDQGRFSCVAPDIKPAHPSWRSETLWIFKRGKKLVTASTFRETISDEKLSNLSIKLEEDVEVTFKVENSEHEPISGVQIEPWHFLSIHQFWDMVPEPIRVLLTTTTDDQGRAKIFNMHKDGLFTLHAISKTLGTQEIRVDRFSNPDLEKTIVMKSAGAIEGQLISEDAQLVNGVNMWFTSLGGLEGDGVAPVMTDVQGKFVVPAIAAGRLMIDVDQDNEAIEFPRFPSSMIVAPNQTLSLQIELEPSVKVWGTIRTGDTDQPVPGAEIYIHYGISRQGTTVVSDANGRYEARVLAGDLKAQVIVIPEEFRHHVQLGDPWAENISVPDSNEPFELPPIRLAPTVRVQGKVLLPSGDPAVKVEVNAIYRNRRYGFATTNELGEFEAELPEGIEIRTFQVWPERSEPSQDIKVERGAPLVLKLKENEKLLGQ